MELDLHTRTETAGNQAPYNSKDLSTPRVETGLIIHADSAPSVQVPNGQPTASKKVTDWGSATSRADPISLFEESKALDGGAEVH